MFVVFFVFLILTGIICRISLPFPYKNVQIYTKVISITTYHLLTMH